MKIQITEGCLAWGIDVDGIPLCEFGTEELIDYLLPKIKEGVLNGAVNIEDVIKVFQYEDSESYNNVCEQCGDSVTTTTWDI